MSASADSENAGSENSDAAAAKELLYRLAVRASDRHYDPRHALLDLSADLLSLQAELDCFAEPARTELRQFLAELESVRPTYPSRRETSPLFDRAGLGRPARERAERMVQRLIGIARMVRKAEK